MTHEEIEEILVRIDEQLLRSFLGRHEANVLPERGLHTRPVWKLVLLGWLIGTLFMAAYIVLFWWVFRWLRV